MLRVSKTSQNFACISDSGIDVWFMDITRHRPVMALINISSVNERKNTILLCSTHYTFDTRCVEVFSTLTNCLIPGRCPTIHFSPDTIYLELLSDPTG